MNPETRPLFLRCTTDGKRFLMTTNSEASEGESAPASRAFSCKVAPFTPAGERTKKAPSRGGRTGSNGQQHPVVIDCEVLQKLVAPLRVTRYSEQARGWSPRDAPKRQGIPPGKRRPQNPRSRFVAV